MSTETESKPLSQDEHVEARDYRVHSITLIDAASNATDITNLVAEIMVRQDIYLGFMSGELLVSDSVGLYTQRNLHGGEYLFLHLTEPEQKTSIKKAFRVYKVGDRRAVHNNVQRYSIYFMSDELFLSNTQKISKAYKDTPVSEIAKDILQNNLKIPSDRIKVDDTTEPMDIILTYKRPAEALNWLATRAFNGDSACWLFYENLDGFNFRSLQSIYKDQLPIKVPFVFDTKIGSQNLLMNKYAIDSLQVKRDFDVLGTLSSGGVAMGLLGIDPFFQTRTSTQYNINEAPKLYPNAPMTNQDELYDKSDAYFLTYLQREPTTTDKATHTESWIKRIMNLVALNNTLLELVVPGNIRLQVGKLINLRVPHAVPPSEGDMWDKQKGGKYLIVAVNHKFDLVNHKFDTILLIARDSVPEALAFDTKLPEKMNKLNAKANRD